MPFTPTQITEISRPDWEIKKLYFNIFDVACQNYENYEVAKQKHGGQGGISERIVWVPSVRRVAIMLWAKINKNGELAADMWPCLVKISKSK